MLIEVEEKQATPLFYVPNESDMPSNFPKRIHGPFSYTYECSNEDLCHLLADCNLKLKTIDDDLLKYLKDGRQLFDEFREKIATIGKNSIFKQRL